jgi:hypothetical protein
MIGSRLWSDYKAKKDTEAFITVAEGKRLIHAETIKAEPPLPPNPFIYNPDFSVISTKP